MLHISVEMLARDNAFVVQFSKLWLSLDIMRIGLFASCNGTVTIIDSYCPANSSVLTFSHLEIRVGSVVSLSEPCI